MTNEQISIVCHEANIAYCALMGDFDHNSWIDSPQNIRESVRMGVDMHLMANVTPEQSHEAWLKFKIEDGWVYGDEKDFAAKTHPCLVPYCDLPSEQKAKDYIFKAIVNTLSKIGDASEVVNS